MAMWKPVTLPYQSTAANVTLPTAQEVRSCQNVLHERYASRIVALNDEVVVKYGRDIDSMEGQALIYLERHVSQVPAPRLYAMYYDSRELFMVMQRVPGVALDRLWPSLADCEKDTIVEELRRIFDMLRNTELPEPYFFGGMDNGAIRHYLFYNQGGGQGHLGPFSDGPAFVKGLTDNFRASLEANKHPDLKVRFYEEHLRESLAGIRPVLTHGDVQRKNIMVHEKDQNTLHKGRSFEIALVDWELAGWLPECWEYFCATMAAQYDSWEDDWRLRAGHFIPVRLAETAVMRMFDKDMGP